MLEEIFSAMPSLCKPGSFSTPTSIYFSVDETKKTLWLDADGCRVEEGRTVENADCVCKTSAEFLYKAWSLGYKPGMKDFLSGAIKSNNPAILHNFLAACGKA